MIPKPDYHQNEEFQNRTKKLQEIRDLGVEPYPHHYSPTHTAQEIIRMYPDAPIGHSEDAAAGTTPEVCVAGRLILFRAMGKNAFAHLQEATHKIQLMFNRDLTHVEGLGDDPECTPLKFIEKKSI